MSAEQQRGLSSNPRGTIQQEPRVRLEVTVESAVDLPRVGLRQRAPDTYVQVSVGDDSERTKTVERRYCPSWNKSFVFHCNPSATIMLVVHAKRTALKDKILGRISAPIALFLSASPTSNGRYEQAITSASAAKLIYTIHIQHESKDSEVTKPHAPDEPLRSGPIDSDNVYNPAVASGSEAGPSIAISRVEHQARSLEVSKAGEDTTRTLTRMSSPAIFKLTSAEASHQSADAAHDILLPLPSLSSFLDNLEIFCDIVKDISTVHPYMAMTWKILSVPYNVIQRQLARDDRIRALFNSMMSLFDIVNDLKEMEGGEVRAIAKSQKDLLPRIAEQTLECCYFIQSYASPGFWTRMTKGILYSIDKRINEYCDVFTFLRQAFYDVLHVGAHAMAAQTLEKLDNLGTQMRITLDILENIDAKIDLNDMPYASGAALEPGKACLPGTRVDFLDGIIDWVNSEEDDIPHVMLLTGPSGSGKSTIASSIANRFRAIGRLGSSFAFSRNRPDRTLDKLFPTIARDMAELDIGIHQALCQQIGGKTALRTTTDLELQFESFLLGPMANLTITGPVVVVIDALDESGDAMTRGPLLSILGKRLKELSPNLRILITSRPEEDVNRVLAHRDGVVVKSMSDITVQSANQDIALYIRARLTADEAPLLHGLNVEEASRQLAGISQGLFQWASVACTTLTRSSPGFSLQERYQKLIDSGSATSEEGLLDSLYMQILSQLCPAHDAELIKRFKTILGFVLAAFEPLSMQEIDSLRKTKNGESFSAGLIVGYLGSLLSGVSTNNQPIVPLHTSFRDFLTDVSRSKAYFIDVSIAHETLAGATLQTMRDNLEFNLCKLESSYQPNRDIPDLAQRISRYIPTHVLYACRFWANHLNVSPLATLDSETHKSLSRSLLSEKLLYWLEILSLLNVAPGASSAIATVGRFTHDPELRDLVNDALRFLAVFGRAISESAPHIYISALPFSPPNSLVSRHFSPRFPGLLRVCGSSAQWPDAQRVMNLDRNVLSVTVSPDGQYAASGCDNGTLWLWSAISGALIHGPLEVRGEYVRLIAFSANSSLLITGLDDGTVWLWDTAKGEPVGEHLAGHTASVLSVSFSSMDSRIMSISKDGTVCIWDASAILSQTRSVQPVPISSHTFNHENIYCATSSSEGTNFASGGGTDGTLTLWTIGADKECQGEILLGHSDEVNFVVFSADDKCLASVSDDCTARIWDVQTRTAIGGPLEGHESRVFAVAFSPLDPTCVVSGSEDRTIRMWSISAKGNTPVRVLQGHTNSINAVSYTADGMYIISGSGDHTFRIWSVDEADNIENGIQANSDEIGAVCFSPNGTSVTSGSDDGKIRAWEADTGRALCKPLAGHTKSIACIAFSRDGAHFVSGSEDKRLQLWKAKTYEPVGEHMDGHDGWIKEVGFTRDDKQIVSVGDDAVRLWDRRTRRLVDDSEQLNDQLPHDGYPHFGAISPDGSFVACGSAAKGPFRVWDLDRRQVILTKEVGFSFWKMVFSPDNASLFLRYDNIVTKVDVKTGAATEWKAVDGYIWCLASSVAGNYIAAGTGKGSIYIWSNETGALISRLISPEPRLQAIAFSPDGRYIAGGAEKGISRIWRVFNENSSDRDDEEPIMFSLEREHALPNSEALFQSFTSALSGDRRQTITLSDDGWMRATVDAETRLLFWVPAHYRTSLTSAYGGMPLTGSDAIQLDLRKFVHGSDWSRCNSQL